jgi:hypothetical protein
MIFCQLIKMYYNILQDIVEKFVVLDCMEMRL